MGQVPASVEFPQPITQQRLGGAFLGWSQDPVLSAPEHLQGLLRQGVAATGEPAGSGKATQGLTPAWGGQMQGGDLQFGGSNARARIGEGGAAESPPHPRPPEEPDPQGIKARRERHGATGETRRRQQ